MYKIFITDYVMDLTGLKGIFLDTLMWVSKKPDYVTKETIKLEIF